MKKITTALGNIRPEELGWTSMHEHTLIDEAQFGQVMLRQIPALALAKSAYQNGRDVREESKRRKILGINDFPKMSIAGAMGARKIAKSNPAAKLTDLEYYTNELIAFHNSGGKSLCDCSPLARLSSAEYQKLSQASGANIVTCAGFYVKAGIPQALRNTSSVAMEKALEQELEYGDGQSSARPGFLKCAFGCLEQGDLSKPESNALIACANTAKRHGMALQIHLAFPLRPCHIQKVADILLNQAHMDASKVVFCHLDSLSLGSGNPVAKINKDGYDPDLSRSLLHQGFCISIDGWGNCMGDRSITDYLDHTRYLLLRELLQAGYAGQIVLGHDFMNKAAGIQNGGYGYTRFLDYLPSQLAQDGIDMSVMQQMAQINPAQILAF